MNKDELFALQEIAGQVGCAVDDLIRLAVCNLIDGAYNNEVTEVRREVVLELTADVAIVTAGRHAVTVMLAQQNDDVLRERLASATRVREIYERGMAHADRLRRERRAA